MRTVSLALVVDDQDRTRAIVALMDRGDEYALAFYRLIHASERSSPNLKRNFKAWRAAARAAEADAKRHSLPAGRIACPNCAELIRAEARVCRHCGNRLSWSRGVSPIWPRVVGTIVYFFAAAPLLVARDFPADQRLLAGLLSAGLLLGIVGTVNWVIARVRKTPRPWWHATFALSPIAIAFALAVLSNAGRNG